MQDSFPYNSHFGQKLYLPSIDNTKIDISMNSQYINLSIWISNMLDLIPNMN